MSKLDNDTIKLSQKSALPSEHMNLYIWKEIMEKDGNKLKIMKCTPSLEYLSKFK